MDWICDAGGRHCRCNDVPDSLSHSSGATFWRPFTNYVDTILPIIDHLPKYPLLTFVVEFLYCYKGKSAWHWHLQYHLIPTSSCQRSLWTPPLAAVSSNEPRSATWDSRGPVHCAHWRYLYQSSFEVERWNESIGAWMGKQTVPPLPSVAKVCRPDRMV